MNAFEHCVYSIPSDADSVNEDYVLCMPELGIFVVADGMGGRPGGATASKTAAETFVSAIRRRNDVEHVSDKSLRYAVNEACDALRQVSMDSPELEGLGSTLLAALLIDGMCRLVHVGDSRAYRLRGGSVELLTRDQTLAEELISRQVWSEDLARRHRLKNVLSQVVGSKHNPRPVIMPLDLRSGDYLLLATDGFSNAVNSTRLAEAAAETAGRSVGEVGAAILRSVSRNALEDDLSLVVIRVAGTYI